MKPHTLTWTDVGLIDKQTGRWPTIDGRVPYRLSRELWDIVYGDIQPPRPTRDEMHAGLSLRIEDLDPVAMGRRYGVSDGYDLTAGILGILLYKGTGAPPPAVKAMVQLAMAANNYASRMPIWHVRGTAVVERLADRAKSILDWMARKSPPPEANISAAPFVAVAVNAVPDPSDATRLTAAMGVMSPEDVAVAAGLVSTFADNESQSFSVAEVRAVMDGKQPMRGVLLAWVLGVETCQPTADVEP